LVLHNVLSSLSIIPIIHFHLFGRFALARSNIGLASSAGREDDLPGSLTESIAANIQKRRQNIKNSVIGNNMLRRLLSNIAQIQGQG